MISLLARTLLPVENYSVERIQPCLKVSGHVDRRLFKVSKKMVFDIFPHKTGVMASRVDNKARITKIFKLGDRRRALRILFQESDPFKRG